MTKIFLYGTLKRNERAHHFVSHHKGKFICETKTHSKYHLYDQGYYPGMVINEQIKGGVHGELFEVSDDCVRELDIYEGIETDLFRKEQIELEDGSKAIAYLIVDPVTDNRIESGVWTDGKAS